MSPRLDEDSESSSDGQGTRRRSTPNNNNMSDDYFYSPASSSSSSSKSTTNTSQQTTSEPGTPNTEDSESRASEHYHHRTPRDDRTYDLFKPYDRPAHEEFTEQAGEMVRQCMRSVSVSSSSSSGDVETLVTPPRRVSCVGWPHLSGGRGWGLVKKKYAEPILTKEERRTLMTWTWNEGVEVPERHDHHRPDSPGGTRYDS
ncbi:hypothetical protein LZ554_000221 [Drepanopeziza brunnea f. sp. 'monogermtubi']|nr:hypothetical protein LZ554_000221 [Drepanopeziza brunnea f. sp. 'monogermtubi']